MRRGELPEGIAGVLGHTEQGEVDWAWQPIAVFFWHGLPFSAA